MINLRSRRLSFWHSSFHLCGTRKSFSCRSPLQQSSRAAVGESRNGLRVMMSSTRGDLHCFHFLDSTRGKGWVWKGREVSFRRFQSSPLQLGSRNPRRGCAHTALHSSRLTVRGRWSPAKAERLELRSQHLGKKHSGTARLDQATTPGNLTAGPFAHSRYVAGIHRSKHAHPFRVRTYWAYLGS